MPFSSAVTRRVDKTTAAKQKHANNKTYHWPDPRQYHTPNRPKTVYITPLTRSAGMSYFSFNLQVPHGMQIGPNCWFITPSFSIIIQGPSALCKTFLCKPGRIRIKGGGTVAPGLHSFGAVSAKPKRFPFFPLRHRPPQAKVSSQLCFQSLRSSIQLRPNTDSGS